MKTPKMRKAHAAIAQQDARATSGQKKPWTRPTLERRGTVADLVQITKKSGGHDFSGSKHLDD